MPELQQWSWKDFARALRKAAPEWLVNLTFATAPYWIGVVVFGLLSSFKGAVWDMPDAILSTLARGDLLAFAVTFLAPSFWTVSLDPDGAYTFPGRPYWVALVAVVLIVASVSFGVWKSQAHTATTYSAVIHLSIALAVFAIVLRLMVLAIHNRRMPPIEKLINGATNDFADKYAQKREEEE